LLQFSTSFVVTLSISQVNSGHYLQVG
jgi:hypothetical protein